MRQVSAIQGGGYLVSMLSVVLLGIPAYDSARKDMTMLLSLIAGMVLSIGGMILRWHAHRLEQKAKDAGE